MRNLPRPVRDKAIAIANALLDDGMDDGKAIRIAIAQAKAWAAHHLGIECAVLQTPEPRWTAPVKKP